MVKADKFYTKREVARDCYNLLKNKLELTGDELFLEPTAGDGAFLDNLKNFEAYDKAYKKFCDVYDALDGKIF